MTPPSASLVLMRKVDLRVDGHRWSPPSRLSSGPHHLVVDGLGVELTVDVEPFSTTVLDLSDDPTPFALLVGSSCTTCDPPEATELDVQPGQFDLGVSARALAKGRWREAAAELRKVPQHARTSRFAVQWAAVVALSHSEVSGNPTLKPLVAAWRSGLVQERQAEREWVLQRWNTATDRFARVTLAMADEAQVVEVARARLEQMSSQFAAATEIGDLSTQRQLGDRAVELTASLAKELVALRPEDCVWRERLQRALDGSR